MDTPTLPPFIPRKPIRYRPRAASAPLVAPGAALTLVAADFDHYAPEVFLTFDRPIDIAALNLAAIAVVDAGSAQRFIGSSAPTLLSPEELWIILEPTGSYDGPDVLLSAGAD